LTFQSYAELRDTFRELRYAEDVDAVLFLPTAAISAPRRRARHRRPAGRHGDEGAAAFTRMTAISSRRCWLRQADHHRRRRRAVGAGAIIVMASDIRIATPEAKTAFLLRASGSPAATWAPVRSCPAS
jgi:hypothetical protein